MTAGRAFRIGRLPRWLAGGVLLALVLGACDSPPNPIVRGSASEHRSNVRVGVPF